MFRREDYWPYMISMFLLAGLVINPLLWRIFLPQELSYGKLVFGSLVTCFVFAVAHLRDGSFSIYRFFIGAAIVAFAYLRLYVKSFSSPHLSGLVLIIPGILIFPMMAATGWIGIGIARYTGINKKLETEDPAYLKTYERPDKQPMEADGTDNKGAVEASGYDGLTQQTYSALLSQTRSAWLSGSLSEFSDNFKATAQNMSPDKFQKVFKNGDEAILFAFKKSPPEQGEFIIAVNNGGVRMSYVLTNKYFYFFGLDDGALANKYEHGRVSLDNIAACEVKEGYVMNKATLTLKSGDTIELKDLMSTEPFMYIKDIINRDHPAKEASSGVRVKYISEFLDRSLRAHKAERPSYLQGLYGKMYRKRVINRPTEQVVSEFMNDSDWMKSLRVAFEGRVPDDDEIYIFMLPGVYMITNKRYYILKDRQAAIALEFDAIESYHTKGGIASNTLKIKPRSGEIIQLKGDFMSDDNYHKMVAKIENAET